MRYFTPQTEHTQILIPVFIEPVPLASDQTPVFIEPVPLASDQTPVFIEPVVLASDQTPVFIEPVPLASDQTYNSKLLRCLLLIYFL